MKQAGCIVLESENVCSFAALDLGVDPTSLIKDIGGERGLFRCALGDIAFLLARDSSRIVRELYYVPEYPSYIRGDLPNAVSCYGFPMIDNNQSGPVELRIGDAGLETISWRKGIKLLTDMNHSGFTKIQQEIFDSVSALDRRLSVERINADHEVMRRYVGPPRGGRVHFESILLSHVPS